MIDRRLITNFDWGLLLLVLVIAGIGVMNIASAAASYGMHDTPYAVRQVYWILIGVIIVLLVCSIDYHLFQDLAYWFYGLLMLLLLVVLFAGKTSMGATRWLHLGFISFQPSELMKIVIIMVYAHYLANFTTPGSLSLRDLVNPFLLLGGPVLLIMKQPDLGTATLVIFIALSMLLYAGVRPRAVITLLLAALPIVFLGWHYYLRAYQKERILTFLSPERDPLGSGYHIIQSKIAVGSGGLTGKGFMQGTQTQASLPSEQHTDFAFSVFSEEWGFIGCLVVLALYFALILWGLNIARRCNDHFGSLMAVGVTAMLFWHIIINIGMVIGLFPVVGVPLPLFSYGGTSMITTMVGLGILLNIRMRRFMF